MKRGLLYKDVGGEALLIDPKTMQLQIIRRAHEKGHFGSNKTETSVRNEYWIPSIMRKVVWDGL